MIRARIVQTNGHIMVSLAGHADVKVCCAAGMMLQAATLGLLDLERQYPKQIEVDVVLPNERGVDAPRICEKRRKR